MSLTAREILAGVLAVQRKLIRPEVLAEALAMGQSPGVTLASASAWASLTADAQTQLDAGVPGLVGDDSPPTLAPSATSPAEEDGALATVAPAAGDEPARAFPAARAARFSRLELHARGGLGAVFLARDEELGRTVALKEIQEQHADDAGCRTRFTFEAEITGHLEHPGIVPVYGLGSYADGRPYYAMRFIKGEPLDAAIRRFHAADVPGRDPAERALAQRGLLRRFVDTCNAIGFAHSRGIIHRDVKPANVMLGEFGETLVVDWGLAKHVGRPDDPGVAASAPGAVGSWSSTGTVEGSAVGTPAYMPPEQALGEQDAMGPRSDVYALGATLYHLLTGKVPVEAEGAIATLQKVIQGERTPARAANASVPKALEAVCEKAMARDPAQRYEGAKELAAEVERWLADEPVRAREETLGERLRRWARRHQAWVLSVGTAVCLGLAVLAVAVVLLTAANERERRARAQAQQNFERAEEATRAEHQAREQAQQDFERAEAAFRTAQEAVDKSFTRVSEEALLNQPGMQKLRRALLDDALTYSRRFLAERKDDPSVKDQYARASFREGRILELTGTPTEALASYQRALKIQRELATADATADRLNALGETLNAVGRAHQVAHRLTEARAHFQQAADARRRVCALSPEDAEAGRRLANSVMNVGLTYKDVGEAAQARCHFEEAQALRAKLLAKRRSLPLVRDRAMGDYNLANLAVDGRKYDDAKVALEAALVGFEEVAAAEPNDLNVRQLVTLCYRLRGDVAALGGEEGKGRKWHARARKGLEELVVRNPDVPDYQLYLGSLHLAVGDVRQREGLVDEAMQEFQAAVAVLGKVAASHPERAVGSRDLAVALRLQAEILARRKQVTEALALLGRSREILEALVKRYPKNADYAAQLKRTRTLADSLDSK